MGDATIAADILDGVLDVTTEVGKSVVIRRVTEGAFINAAQPTLGKTADSTDDYVVLAIISDYEDDLIDGSRILFGDRRVIVDIKDLAITISTSDTFLDNSYAIGDVDDAAETFTVSGEDATAIFSAGAEFVVTGSTGNDGTWTVDTSVLSGADTVITVTGNITNATVDGNITTDFWEIIRVSRTEIAGVDCVLELQIRK